jgi:hypothetical protein
LELEALGKLDKAPITEPMVPIAFSVALLPQAEVKAVAI